MSMYAFIQHTFAECINYSIYKSITNKENFPISKIQKLEESL